MKCKLRLAFVLTIAFGCSFRSARADAPDFLADKIVCDGAGFVDTGCKFEYGKTSRVKMFYETKSKGWDLATPNSDRRCLFAIWPTSGSSRSVACYTAAGHLQVWGNAGEYKDHYTDYAMKGVCTVEVNYSDGTYTWYTNDAPKVLSGSIAALTADSSDTYYLFGYQLGGDALAAVTMTKFCLYEKAAGAATETLAHEFVPCCKNGRAALYDTQTESIVFPTTDGFTLVGDYSLSVAAGGTLVVTKVDCQPKSLSLAGAATLVFDGQCTLSPESVVQLPASGTITVGLSAMRGKGRYVLMENLPANFDLGRFAVGSLPADCTGVLSKSGTTLVLTLTGGSSRTWPDAIGGTLASDACGHVDTGYKFVCSAYPKTARVVLDFNTTNKAVGSATGPHLSASSSRALFGYISSGQMVSYAQWAGSTSKIWGGGWAAWEGTPVTGDDTVEIDYRTGGVKWGTRKGTLAVCTSDSDYSYWLFDRNYRLNAGYNPTPSVYDLKRFRIYETSDGETETLVRDFIPCISDGRAALYDSATGAVKYPAGDTNGFVSTSADWRVKVNAETIYCTTGTVVSIACGETATADGYLVCRDGDGGFVARGSGNAASFTMPAAAVSVAWSHDVTVAEDETKAVSARLDCHDLALASGARVDFSNGGEIFLSGDLTLPATPVKIGFASFAFPGVYTLIRGVEQTVGPSAFEVVSVPAGMAGVIERHGDCIVLRLTEDASSSVGILGQSLTTDGAGWIDTGYFYRADDERKTTRIAFVFDTVRYGVLPGEDLKTTSLLGYRVDGTSLSYARYKVSDAGSLEGTQIWSGRTGATYKAIIGSSFNGSQTLELDYENVRVAWNTTTYAENFAPSQVTATKSYYLASANGNNAPAYMTIRSFKAWEKDATDAVTLACDIVPTLKGGVPGAYDRVSDRFIAPSYKTETVDGFSVGFGCVTQDFSTVRTVCDGRLVETPAFAPQDAFTFRTNGTITAKKSVQALLMTSYDAAGSVLSTKTVSPVTVGVGYAVALGAAASVTVKAVGLTASSADAVCQSFEKLDVCGSAEALERQTGRRTCEYMIPGAATLTFKEATCSVTADLYYASGLKAGEEVLAESVEAGGTIVLSASDSADYRIVKVTFRPPGLLLQVR